MCTREYDPHHRPKTRGEAPAKRDNGEETMNGISNAMARVALIAASCMLAACASSQGGGGGGGGGGTPVPAPESACNPQYSKAGCGSESGNPVIMQCVASTAGAVDAGSTDSDAAGAAAPTGTWKKTSACASGEYCQMVTPAGGGDAAPVCKKQTTPVADAGGTGTDSTSTTKTPAEEFSCMQTQCAALMASCMANANCAGLVNCAKACATDACAEACAENATIDDALLALLLPLDACGKEKGCIVEAPTTDCGNGQCESGETKESCPSDCKTTGPVCGNGQCESGETVASCPSDCKTTGPVCGNGQCESGENVETCPQDCGSGPECTMDSHCGGGKKCVDQKCVTSDPGSCGNETCEPSEVSAMNCNDDCGKTPASGSFPECALEACSSSLQACLMDQKCLAAGNCVTDCGESESCQGQCISAAGSAAAAKIGQIQSCMAEACSGPVCGNGTCEPGESASSCPTDCKTTGPVCGNGTCESGESESNCPEDCGGGGTCASSADCGPAKNCQKGACVAPPAGTCNGKCGGAGDGGSCYCDDACEEPDYGDCCADKAQYCGAP